MRKVKLKKGEQALLHVVKTSLSLLMEEELAIVREEGMRQDPYGGAGPVLRHSLYFV